MPDRLSALDASFLFAEQRTAAMHVGAVLVFDPPGGRSGGTAGGPAIDADTIAALIESRLGLVPRFRQKLREVPGRLGLPVWVDDPDFDPAYHLRRSALAAPGTDVVLGELVGRLLSRQLDRTRPLWEIYLVEGVSDGRFAVITKIHHALLDGLAQMGVGALLLDPTPTPREVAVPPWSPCPEPSAAELVVDAVAEALRRPRAAVDAASRLAGDAEGLGREVGRLVTGAARSARSMVAVRPVSALNTATGAQRRFGTAALPLARHSAVRRAHGGTVNDVVLAVVAGALRRWLVGRGEPLTAGTAVRALVPVSVRPRSPGTASRAQAEHGNRVSGVLVDLPVAESDPLTRLAAVRSAVAAGRRAGEVTGTTVLVGLAGWVPPALHGLGAWLAGRYSSNLYNVLVSSVPGPPRPLYACGARLREIYPLVPLAGEQAVAIGVTAYAGVVHYGLTVDRDAVPDVDVLASALSESLAELAAS